MEWLKRAFAIDPPGPATPTELQKAVVDRICREIIKRRLTTPALLFLESWRPMNYLSAQALHYFAPLVSVLADAQQYTAFADFLAQRGSVDYLCVRIEELESLCHEDEHKPREETTEPRPQS